MSHYKKSYDHILQPQYCEQSRKWDCLETQTISDTELPTLSSMYQPTEYLEREMPTEYLEREMQIL